MTEGYDVAQICLNGHVINKSSIGYPHSNSAFCATCGAKTITACLHCEAPIRGHYIGSMNFQYTVPKYCINCGRAYPWTETVQQVAHDLAEAYKLSPDELTNFDKDIETLLKDSPAVPVAAMRYKNVMGKLGSEAAKMFRDVLVNIMSETAKKMMFP